MIFHEHDEATCPDCENALYYALKSETDSWKILYQCDNCAWENTPRRIQRATVDSMDDAWEQAEKEGITWS